MTQLSPSHIMEVGMAFWPAKVLLSAIELGLFTELGAKAMTGRELQEALRLHRRRVYHCWLCLETFARCAGIIMPPR